MNKYSLLEDDIGWGVLVRADVFTGKGCPVVEVFHGCNDCGKYAWLLIPVYRHVEKRTILRSRFRCPQCMVKKTKVLKPWLRVFLSKCKLGEDDE